jgi:hypothetical protein
MQNLLRLSFRISDESKFFLKLKKNVFFLTLFQKPRDLIFLLGG